MANSSGRDGDVSKLHPAIRDKVLAIRNQLHKEKIPFEVFEAFRTPERQAILQAKRPKVTWVGPWGSIHQYGLAVDFVLKINGKWSWDDKGAEAAYWDRMHELAKEHEMTPLYNRKGQLIEKPHIQLAGVSASTLRKGQFPEGGDHIWAEQLAELIDNWSGTGAPPKPTIVPGRPPLDPQIVADLEAEETELDPAANASDDTRFKRLHEFIKKWEGGFVNHPADKGGATNMGVTIGTLGNWRGAEVSITDVRDLSREEADEIFRARYYSACRCGEMPERIAAVVYNAAVMSGSKRAIQFVQQAFNGTGLKLDGKELEVDGVLGRLTMSAVRQTDASTLSDAFMDIQEAYLHNHDSFDVFGDGWLNRMAALREFVAKLPKGAGVRPAMKMEVSDREGDLAIMLESLDGKRDGSSRQILARFARLLLRRDADDRDTQSKSKSLARLILGVNEGESIPAEVATTVTKGPDGKPPLTPINAALGETIGQALNGKKSVSGLVGLVATALLPKLGISGDIVTFVSNNADTLTTLFAIATGWGMFGKLDKAIRLMGMIDGRK